MVTLDATDVLILEQLSRDSRMSYADLGRAVDLVPSAVLQRVRKLRERNVVLGHETRINPSAIGFGMAAFIFVRVDENLNTQGAAARLSALPEVLEVHHVAGDDCYLVKVRTTDAHSLGTFLRDHIGSIESVQSTRTIVVLDTIKETGTVPVRLSPAANPD